MGNLSTWKVKDRVRVILIWHAVKYILPHNLIEWNAWCKSVGLVDVPTAVSDLDERKAALKGLDKNKPNTTLVANKRKRNLIVKLDWFWDSVDTEEFSETQTSVLLRNELKDRLTVATLAPHWFRLLGKSKFDELCEGKELSIDFPWMDFTRLATPEFEDRLAIASGPKALNLSKQDIKESWLRMAGVRSALEANQ